MAPFLDTYNLGAAEGGNYGDRDNHELANRRTWERLEAAGAELRDVLGRSTTSESVPSEPNADSAAEPPGDRFSAAGLHRLKLMSDRLRDPSVRGEVLSLILEFAAESFSRVAIFGS